MVKFSSRTLEMLHRAGWSEKRIVALYDHIVWLRQSEFSLPPVAVDFLHHYGGIKVHHPGPTLYHEVFALDPTPTGPYIAREFVKDMEEVVGMPLCPIGSCGNQATLLMDNDGNVYITHDEEILVRIAHSGEEAIEGLCTGQMTSERVWEFVDDSHC